jgi:hypothetical protein
MPQKEWRFKEKWRRFVEAGRAMQPFGKDGRIED